MPVRKYGTLIFRPGTDLVPLLCEALWKIKRTEQTKEQACREDETIGKISENNAIQFEEVSKLILEQIRSFLDQEATLCQNYDQVDFDDIISRINPCLWNIVSMLTRSTSELQGTSKVDDPTSPVYRLKRMRRLFVLCCMMYCADDRCSMPLHTLIADAIDSQGGSTLLIQLMNRSGICASNDTLARFIQHRASVFRATKGKHLTPQGFTVVSADNIDFTHSNARVFGGNQCTSWHGTTVQAVQPLPSLSVMTDNIMDYECDEYPVHIEQH